MDISFGPSDTYPVPVTRTIPGLPQELAAELTTELTDRISERAWERLEDYLRARETEAPGSIASEPLLKDLAHLIAQYTTAQASLELVSKGTFSTAEKTKYAGGIESPGNRIFTAEEMAQNALNTLQELEARTI